MSDAQKDVPVAERLYAVMTDSHRPFDMSVRTAHWRDPSQTERTRRS